LCWSGVREVTRKSQKPFGDFIRQRGVMYLYCLDSDTAIRTMPWCHHGATMVEKMLEIFFLLPMVTAVPFFHLFLPNLLSFAKKVHPSTLFSAFLGHSSPT